MLGAFLGKKRVSVSTLGRATTAVRGVGRTMKESQDIDRAEETLDVLKNQLAELQARFQAETEEIATRISSRTEPLETFEIRPKKSNVSVNVLALVWVPYWQDEQGRMKPAWT